MEKNRLTIRQLLQSTDFDTEVTVKGWLHNKRTAGNEIVFLNLNDGSTVQHIQVVANPALFDEKSATIGSCLRVKGKLAASKGSGQAVEVLAEEIEIYGSADPEKYPLQPKKHSLEFLRENAHLRMRTRTFGAVFRLRHQMAFAVHQFFHERGFFLLHTPVITGSDAEGAGQMFRVTTLDFQQFPKNPTGEVDFAEDFFGKETHLTVSGQLEGELGALALSKIYTFGPTFRAENSNTPRHLAEFWMIEPEMAFYELEDNMALAEELLRYLTKYALEYCDEDLQFLEERLLEEEKTKKQEERSDMDLRTKLRFVAENDFEKLTYTQAIEILLKSKPYQKKQFKYPVAWGVDLQSEHERYLVEKHFKKPVILTNYPKNIKAFYMKQDEDGKTVRAMDVLFPGIGEIIGGSQREEDYGRLVSRMQEMQMHPESLDWYLDTRRFGTAPHSGFGLGFERLMLFVSGMTNIRDVIPFPRFPQSAEF
jgi:asparaginyl-tRNA synthetase